MAKGQKVYMPVMIGDWLKGTRGMRADVRGVYMGLLLHQWEKGFIPSDIYELEEIEREVNKVWDKIKDKFKEVAPGKLQNEKLEEVRDFWQKQKKNGKKGGRPKKEKPEPNPIVNPKENPNTNLHNDLDLDNEDLKNKKESEISSDEFKYEYTDYSQPDIAGDDLFFPVDTEPVRNLWATWKKYRYEVYNLRYGMMGEQADLKRLEGMDFDQIQETILKAISGKWKNLYPEKNGTGKTTQRTDAVNARREAFARRHSTGTGS